MNQGALDALAMAASSSPSLLSSYPYAPQKMAAAMAMAQASSVIDSPATSPPGSPVPQSPELGGCEPMVTTAEPAPAPATSDGHAALAQQIMMRLHEQQQQQQQRMYRPAPMTTSMPGPAQMMQQPAAPPQQQMLYPAQPQQQQRPMPQMVPMRSVPAGAAPPPHLCPTSTPTPAGQCQIVWQPMWVPTVGGAPTSWSTAAPAPEPEPEPEPEPTKPIRRRRPAPAPRALSKSAAPARTASTSAKVKGSRGSAGKSTKKRASSRHPTAVEVDYKDGGSEQFERPNHSYAQLAAAAIMALPSRKATVKQIYEHIVTTHAFYAHAGAPWWKNCIRHNLSMKPCFVRHTNAGGAGVHLWSVAPGITSVDAIPCRRRGSRNVVVAKAGKPAKATKPNSKASKRAAAAPPPPPPIPARTSPSSFGGLDSLLEAAGHAEVAVC